MNCRRDEDFLYLHLDGKLIGTWSIKSGITIQGIEKAINDFSKGGYTDTGGRFKQGSQIL